MSIFDKLEATEKREPKMNRALLIFPYQGEGWVLCYKGSDFHNEYDIAGSFALDLSENEGVAEKVTLNGGMVVIDFTITYSGGGKNEFTGDYADPYVHYHQKAQRRPTEEELKLIVEGKWDGLRELWSDIEQLRDPTSLQCPHDEVFGMTDQPTTCPKCGARTDFEDIDMNKPTWHQHHKCLGCGFEFAVEE